MSDNDEQSACARWITRDQAAQRLGVHPNTIKRWATEGRVKTYRFGPRLVRYDPAEIDAIATHTTSQEPANG